MSSTVARLYSTSLTGPLLESHHSSPTQPGKEAYNQINVSGSRKGDAIVVEVVVPAERSHGCEGRACMKTCHNFM